MKILIVFFGSLVLLGCSSQKEQPIIDQSIEGKFDSLLLESTSTKFPENVDNRFVQHDSFPARDSLLIFADIYERKDSKPTILLCHQAGYSRGEYNVTAFMLGNLGFSSVAIDQRSGEEVNGVINKTAALAKHKELPNNYMDARQDIEAAIDYIFEKNENQPIVLVGSSYSASLVLLIGKNNDKVKAIASFSPGEYLKGINVHDSLIGYSKPIFVTSSKTEIEATKVIISGIDTTWVNHFEPNFEGIHGSSALWESTKGNEDYWNAFKEFLKSI